MDEKEHQNNYKWTPFFRRSVQKHGKHNHKTLSATIGMSESAFSMTLRREHTPEVFLREVLAQIEFPPLEIEGRLTLFKIAQQKLVDDSRTTLSEAEASLFGEVTEAIDSEVPLDEVILERVLPHYGWSMEGIDVTLAAVLRAQPQPDRGIEALVLYAHACIAHERNQLSEAHAAYQSAIAWGLPPTRERWTRASQASLYMDQGLWRDAMGNFLAILGEVDDEGIAVTAKERLFVCLFMSICECAHRRQWQTNPARIEERLKDAEAAGEELRSDPRPSAQCTHWLLESRATLAYVEAVARGGELTKIEGPLRDLQAIARDPQNMLAPRALEATGICHALLASAWSLRSEPGRAALHRRWALDVATGTSSGLTRHLLTALPGLAVLLFGLFLLFPATALAGDSLHRPSRDEKVQNTVMSGGVSQGDSLHVGGVRPD